jgi:hypothetical protein
VSAGATHSARWSPWHAAILAFGLIAAAVVRLILLPTPGLTGDLDQFVLWVHGIATQPLGRAYDQNLSFPPVMIYVWGVLAMVEPGFRSAMDSADPGIRAIMKTPASLADFGLAAGVAYALRARPAWAIVAALGIALHPAVIDVSAWWGQYESIYVLAGLVAFLLAVADRPLLASIALTVALMTKPQALPFLVPFGAWFLGRYGLRRSLAFAAVGVGTIVVLWLPFIPAGGPGAYLRNLSQYQGDIFAVLSLRAWNPWWLVQEAYGAGEFISDSSRVAGPLTLRALGLVAAAVLEGLVFLTVIRAPSPRTLTLGLAASTLVAFASLTTMHERYAFAALVFLAPLIPDRRVFAAWLTLGVVMTVNLLAAAPPSPELAAALPIFGTLGVVGSVAMTCLTVVLVVLLLRDSSPLPAKTSAERDAIPAQVVG